MSFASIKNDILTEEANRKSIEDQLVKNHEERKTLEAKISKANAAGLPANPTDQSDSPGWFFVFKEIVGEVNYGLDAASTPILPPYNNWNDVDWAAISGEVVNFDTSTFSHSQNLEANEFNNISFGGLNSSAAMMAFITYRKPSLVAYHSQNLIL